MNLDMLLLQNTLQMQIGLNLKLMVECLCPLGSCTAVASVYQSASRGMSRGYTHTHIHTHSCRGELRRLGTGRLVHTIHYHPETTANASTKAKLKVEPFSPLHSSFFLSLQ